MFGEDVIPRLSVIANISTKYFIRSKVYTDEWYKIVKQRIGVGRGGGRGQAPPPMI